MNRVQGCVLSLVLVVTVVILLAFSGGWRALAQEEGWTAPTVVSAPPGYSWFPDLAVDAFGSVHTVWCLTIPVEGGLDLEEQVAYASLKGESWSEPNDIVPPSADIVRNALATDRAGNVHLIFGGSVYGNNFVLYYKRASGSEAWSARTWSAPHRINQGISYMGDIAVDSQGVIHVVYDDAVRHTGEGTPSLSDIFYRRSADDGETWSPPIALHPEPSIGAARPYIEVDSNDTIHVSWDVGWDRLSGGVRSDVFYSVYVSSSDGGHSWSPPTVIDYPDAMVVQLTAGSDGQGGVMLVWRSRLTDEIFYQWSTDGGQSWEAPSAIPGVFARPWTTPFDMYDMAADSAGHIHLLAVGRLSQARDAMLGVYHLVWDGERWSLPTRLIAAADLYPEYPKIIVHEGNQLHAAWFTREGSEFEDDSNREVWYSTSQSSAPYQPATPLPSPTPVPPTAMPTPVPTITPYPTVSFENTGLPDDLHTDSDDALRLAIALSPVALIVLAVVVAKMGWLGRVRR